MNDLFSSRPTIEVDPKNPPNIYAPQAVIVKGVRSDGLFYKVDIGRICYLERDKDSGRSSGAKYKSFGLVNADSLSSERVDWLRNYLDVVFHKGWRDETLRGQLHYLRYFFHFCDFDGGSKPTTLTGLVKDYEHYHIVLDQRARMNGCGAIGASAVDKRLKAVRNFIQLGFQFSSNEILAYISKYRGGKSIPEVREVEVVQ